MATKIVFIKAKGDVSSRQSEQNIYRRIKRKEKQFRKEALQLPTG
jgi:hypothetical protein